MFISERRIGEGETMIISTPCTRDVPAAYRMAYRDPVRGWMPFAILSSPPWCAQSGGTDHGGKKPTGQRLFAHGSLTTEN